MNPELWAALVKVGHYERLLLTERDEEKQKDLAKRRSEALKNWAELYLRPN
jgi:hypothetical protein